MLTNRINTINFRVMQLSQQQQTLAQAAGNLQRSVAMMKNIFGTIGDTVSRGFQMNTLMSQQSIMQSITIDPAADALQKEKRNNPSREFNEAEQTTIKNAQMQYYQDQQAAQMQAQQQAMFGQMAMSAGQQAMGFFGQMMDLQSEGQLKRINDAESQIELERKTLETQLKAMTAELEAVEKAEDNAIKASAPKYA